MSLQKPLGPQPPQLPTLDKAPPPPVRIELIPFADNKPDDSGTEIIYVVTDMIEEDDTGCPVGLLSDLLPLAAESNSPLKSQSTRLFRYDSISQVRTHLGRGDAVASSSKKSKIASIPVVNRHALTLQNDGHGQSYYGGIRLLVERGSVPLKVSAAPSPLLVVGEEVAQVAAPTYTPGPYATQPQASPSSSTSGTAGKAHYQKPPQQHEPSLQPEQEQHQEPLLGDDEDAEGEAYDEPEDVAMEAVEAAIPPSATPPADPTALDTVKKPSADDIEYRLDGPIHFPSLVDKQQLLAQASNRIEWLRSYFGVDPVELPGKLSTSTAREALDRWIPVRNAKRIVLSKEWRKTVSKGFCDRFGSYIITNAELREVFGYKTGKWGQDSNRWLRTREDGLLGAPTVIAWASDPDGSKPENAERIEAFSRLNHLPFGQLNSFVRMDRAKYKQN